MRDDDGRGRTTCGQISSTGWGGCPTESAYFAQPRRQSDLRAEAQIATFLRDYATHNRADSKDRFLISLGFRPKDDPCVVNGTCLVYYECYTSSMSAIRVTAVGNSVGIILPKELVVRLRLARGDQLHVVETSRGIELTPYDPALEVELKAGRSIARRYRSALRKLAR